MIKSYKVKLAQGNLPWKPVVDNFDASYDFITNNGPDFFFVTTKNAPKFKVKFDNFSSLIRCIRVFE